MTTRSIALCIALLAASIISSANSEVMLTADARSAPQLPITQPGPPGKVDVVLPSWLDPDHHIYRLELGTRVYDIPSVMTQSKEVKNGKVTGVQTPVTGFELHVQAHKDGLYIVTDVGSGYKLGYPVIFYYTRGYDLRFYPPGRPLPHYLAHRNPDYVVH